MLQTHFGRGRCVFSTQAC